MDMIILYLFVIAYIAAINLYAFLLIKTLAKQERDAVATVPPVNVAKDETSDTAPTTTSSVPTAQKPQKVISKLCITGALGGAIAIYACMFIYKYRRNDLFLMVIMPLLGVLNVYLWVLLFKSGFSFLLIRP